MGGEAVEEDGSPAHLSFFIKDQILWALSFVVRADRRLWVS